MTGRSSRVPSSVVPRPHPSSHGFWSGRAADTSGVPSRAERRWWETSWQSAGARSADVPVYSDWVLTKSRSLGAVLRSPAGRKRRKSRPDALDELTDGLVTHAVVLRRRTQADTGNGRRHGRPLLGRDGRSRELIPTSWRPFRSRMPIAY